MGGTFVIPRHRSDMACPTALSDWSDSSAWVVCAGLVRRNLTGDGQRQEMPGIRLVGGKSVGLRRVVQRWLAGVVGQRVGGCRWYGRGVRVVSCPERPL